MKLFLVMLGGRHPRALTEVHDIAIVAAEKMQAAYPALRRHWFGSQHGLHIDSWLEFEGIDHYRFEFKDHPATEQTLKLYFINLGGYREQAFGEEHSYDLVVAQSADQAKQISKQRRNQFEWLQGHTDYLADVDDCIQIEHVGEQYLHLVASDTPLQKPTPEHAYIRLDQ